MAPQYAGCQDDKTILWACFEDCAYGAALHRASRSNRLDGAVDEVREHCAT